MSEIESIRVLLDYPLEQVKEPIIYHLVTDYHLVPNIRRANIDVRTGGFLFLELSGERQNLDRALDWLQATGIDIDAIGLDGTQEWAI